MHYKKILWDLLLPKLEINGLAKVLLDNCALVSWENNQICLEVAPEQKVLANEKQVERIAGAVAKAVDADVAVSIAGITKSVKKPIKVSYYKFEAIVSFNDDDSVNQLHSWQFQPIEKPNDK